MIHLFDLDGTLVRKNTSYAFYFYLIKKGACSWKSIPKMISLYFLYRFRKISLSAFHTRVFSTLFQDFSLSELTREAEQFFPPFFHRYFHPAIVTHALRAKNRGEKIVLLSSSPQFLVEQIRKYLPFDDIVGTHYSIDKEGRLCDISSLITGPEKRKIAKQYGIDPLHVVAYSDSREDLCLLEWAGLPFAVRPDRRLAKIAKKRGWPIIE